MFTNNRISGISIKAKLSLLWIFVLVNMAYADILSLIDATSPIRQAMQGAPLPSGGLIAGAILMETGIAMILLSRVLKGQVNRWVNIFVAAINILAVVGGGHGLYYIFFATLEVSAMLLIIWLAWRWEADGAATQLND